jgi:ParB/RepB/Spo0J family partition protein
MGEEGTRKAGEAIPISKFFVSNMNIRAEEEFGKTDEDFILTQHLTKQDLVQPIIARPEGNGYGVIIGRRRFLAKKKAGAKALVVGKDVLIKTIDDEQALDESVRENLDTFRQGLNPIARAKALKKLLEAKEYSLRDLARVWKVPLSNLSEWLRVLELTPKLQELVTKGSMNFTEALTIAHLQLDTEIQNKLAETLEKQGHEAFRSELAGLKKGKEKRGLPAGKYEVLRLTWDKTDYLENGLYKKLAQLARVMGKTVEETAKILLRERLEEHQEPGASSSS